MSGRRVAGTALHGWLADPLLAAWEAGDLDDPDRWMAAGVTLKSDASSWVVRRDALVIKRERYPDRLRRLRRGWRRSRARRAAESAAGMAAAGIAVAPVLGWLERRRFGWLLGSWLISSFVPGPDARGALASSAGDATRRARQVAALATLVHRLQAGGWVHGDLKASNVLFPDDDGPVLIDLHAARRSRRSARDRRRLLANWRDAPEIAALLTHALER